MQPPAVVGLPVVVVAEPVGAAEIGPELAHLVEPVVVGPAPVLELDSAVKLALLPGLAVAGGLVASWQSELAAYFAFAADSTDSVAHGLVPLEPEHSLAVGALLLAEPSSSVDAESVSLILR